MRGLMTGTMALVLVAQIQLVVLLCKAQALHSNLQIAVLRERPALAATGGKPGHRHTQRYAGLAAITVGAVSEHTASAKAALHQA